MSRQLSIIVPARNEAGGLARVLPQLAGRFPGAEILVVDDGSTDATAEVAARHGARVIRHPYGMGNGAAVKTGARCARGEVLLFMDADGQHTAADAARLLERLEEGFEMVVGARKGASQASYARWFGNALYNRFASWVVSRPIPDLTSGLRAARARRFREFLHLLPNGFSYPTTITMAFFRSGYPVGYEPIETEVRVGRSHLKLVRDGVRFFLIMFRVGTLYAPLKIFLPISLVVFVTGVSYYLYTFATSGRFTNMSALLLIAALLIFLIGLVSEQITMLLYQKAGKD